ncbi:MAG TPA: EthD family reductase [Sphingomonas sp.]|nr:EthD family reductase [Sphingomonas sp.]
MVVVNVLYPSGTRLDRDYYMQTHIPMVHAGWSAQLSGVRVLKGVDNADGSAPAYQMIAELTFASAADLQAAMGGSATPGIMGDIANFTDGQPVLQVSEVVG